MKKAIPIAISLLIVLLGTHILANLTGLYSAQIEEGFVWVDNILHILAGLAMGILWIGLQKKVHASSILLFVIVTALLWEAAELSFYLLFPEQAMNFKTYSPSLSEAFFDILSNILGGGILIGALKLK